MSKKRSRWDVKPSRWDAKEPEVEEPPKKKQKVVHEASNTNQSPDTPPMQRQQQPRPHQQTIPRMIDEEEEEEEEESTQIIDPNLQPPTQSTTQRKNSIHIKGLGDVTMEEYEELRWRQEMSERNGVLTDEDLDNMFPTTGYQILKPPPDYNPQRKEKKFLTSKLDFYSIPEGISPDQFGITLEELEPSLPQLKPDDLPYFSKLLEKGIDEDELSKEEKREREIMKLLLKIKNGTPIMRKHALKYITNHAKRFGGKLIFGQLIPLLMSPTLEDLERHYLVKVLDRMIYKLDDEIRPWTHKILVVVEPLLIEQDHYARAEGREVIANLSKAVGLAQMISIMRTDISSPNEYVRNTTARTFAVVAGALGIPSLLPFLNAVCRSKRSWEARHTGIKIFQQMALLMGCGILPHLSKIVDIIKGGLEDEQVKVRIMTCYTISALAEAAYPYGIESFDCVLRNLFFGISTNRGRPLAAFLRAMGSIIPLMTEELAANYATNIIGTLIREFYSQDDEMRFVVLKVLEQCISTNSLTPKFIRDNVLKPFCLCFWTPATALGRKANLAVISTSLAIAKAIGPGPMVEQIVHHLRHQSEPFRLMVLQSIQEIVKNLGTDDLSKRLEERLVDGCIYSFQQIGTNERTGRLMCQGIGEIFTALGQGMARYLPKLGGMVKHRFLSAEAKTRMEAADLLAYLAPIFHKCGEEKLLQHFSTILYEHLGEEFPEALGSIVNALKSIVDCLGMAQMTPPIKDLLPRLTVVLKNRNEKVQQHTIDLVGMIACKGAEYVPEREWMRICFELLEMLKAHRKTVRQAAMNSFGYIARAIGPQDVISTLLSNLRVQERTLRVCTTIAIAIVGESCGPFNIIPALMNEYKVPEQNVQNGVLKALAFLFEYIGETAKDYIYAILPMLEDALTDRDQVHRQIACNVVKHIAMGVFGMGYEDALQHLLNLVFPNILEMKNIHFIHAAMEAVDALRVSLGPGVILNYTYRGLFHPSRKIRNIYWKIYNNTYIYNSDAMVAFLPRLNNLNFDVIRKKKSEIRNSEENIEIVEEEDEDVEMEIKKKRKLRGEMVDEEDEDEKTLKIVETKSNKNNYNRDYLDLFI